ncbi:cyclic nucleotide-gated channel 13 [Actinidia rufa]|uniref:Cyclic nucleotide-gated channel 13 n=1 Tax=Actinidia rufa TaxID=165716 RepID=A0A7J0FG74_9ERIC|nr:cyclic nucleotide-gated channel 13 [Actinidia rufa]
MNLNRDKFVRFQNSPSEGSSSSERRYSTQDGPWISRRSILGSVVGSTRRGFEKVSKGIQSFRISLGNHRRDSRPTQELGSGKKILDPQAPFLQGWNKIFVITCVIAVSLDPLFFYVPVINGVRKCLTVYCPFFASIWEGELVKDSRAIAKKYLSSYFIVDVLAILPLPQLVIFTLQTNASVTLATKESLKAVIFCQYVPRLIRIYPLIKEVNRTSGIFAETAWAAAAFNLFLYMLASNVVGAFWYLLTIERQDRCWNDVCGDDCDRLYCEAGIEANTFLNDSCLLLEPNEIKNPEDFDFGIFLDALKSRIVEERDFPRKFFYCFWWGLQSLSSLGQNLKTSTFVGEVLFAVFISILGLVLFSLLIGNMQKYLQSINVRVEEMRVKRRDAEQWMSHRMLPENLKERIRRYEQYKWQETRGVEEETLIRNLPKDIRRDIKRHLCWSLLKRVPMFDKMDQQLLDAMCDRLKPVLYTQTSFIVREGDPVDEMLFVMRGNLLTMTTNGGRTGFFNSVFLTAGDFCGEELLTWALDPNSSSSLPTSTRTAKAITDVEAFALGAEDLKFVASQFYSQQWRTWGACFIQVAWRRYCRRKIEKSLREEEDRLQDALANEFGSSPSLGATLYAAKFAANALRAIRHNHAPSPKLPRRLPNLLLQKPSEPDFAAEDL